MRYLLDTHILLWAMDQYERLPDVAYQIIKNPENTLFFSTASIWEIAIKYAKKRTDFDSDPHEIRFNAIHSGYLELAIMGNHAAGVAMLPNIHNDPFDRLLISQAIIEDATLITHDKIIAKYPGPIEVV